MEGLVQHNLVVPVIAVLGMALAVPATAIAHGTSDPGPHGGEIRMPGAFHVEAVAGDDALRIYVLDMQFDDPTVEATSLDARIEQGGTTTRLDCEPDENIKAFICPLPADTNLDAGKLIIDAQRKGKPAEPAQYDLPLKWSGQ